MSIRDYKPNTLSYILLHVRMLKAHPKFELSNESPNKDLPICLFLEFKRT